MGGDGAHVEAVGASGGDGGQHICGAALHDGVGQQGEPDANGILGGAFDKINDMLDPIRPILDVLSAPIPATKYAMERTGMSLDDIDLVEINEAFAPVVCAWAKELDVDLGKVNVNGGAIALGHPLGATGAKLMTTLLHELERTGGRYGLQTMCEGGGQANVTIIERLD